MPRGKKRGGKKTYKRGAGFMDKLTGIYNKVKSYQPLSRIDNYVGSGLRSKVLGALPYGSTLNTLYDYGKKVGFRRRKK
jgi:hypothetical protein